MYIKINSMCKNNGSFNKLKDYIVNDNNFEVPFDFRCSYCESRKNNLYDEKQRLLESNNNTKESMN